MTPERKRELDQQNGRLTVPEMQEGYHFCREWDFLCIGPKDKEFEACICTLKWYKPDKGNS